MDSEVEVQGQPRIIDLCRLPLTWENCLREWPEMDAGILQIFHQRYAFLSHDYKRSLLLKSCGEYYERIGAFYDAVYVPPKEPRRKSGVHDQLCRRALDSHCANTLSTPHY